MRKSLEVEVLKTEYVDPGQPTEPSDTPIMPRKRFWRVRAITGEGGTRPDVPEGIPWVGNTDGEWYVVVTPPEYSIPGAEEITFEEAARTLESITDGVKGDDVGEVWGVM